MRKQILLVIFTLFALNDVSRAGWHSDAWPSDTSFRGTTITQSLWVSFVDDIFTNVVGTVTNVYTNTIKNAVVTQTNNVSGHPRGMSTVFDWSQSNMVLQVRDIRLWDAWQATVERETTAATSNRYPMWFYRYDIQDLDTDPAIYGIDAIKDWIVANAPYFLCTTNPFVSATVGANTYTNATPNYWTLETLLEHNSMPTNYTVWTPFRNINGSGISYGSIVTSSVTMVSTSSTVTGYWGSESVVTGAIGSTVTFTDTNANILAGFTTADYGWAKLTNLFDDLVWTYALPTWAVSNQVYWLGTSDVSFAAAETDLAEVTNVVTPWHPYESDAAKWTNDISPLFNVDGLRMYSQHSTTLDDRGSDTGVGIVQYVLASAPGVVGYITNAIFNDVDGWGANQKAYIPVYTQAAGAAALSVTGQQWGAFSTNNPHGILHPLAATGDIKGARAMVGHADSMPPVIWILQWDFDYQ